MLQGKGAQVLMSEALKMDVVYEYKLRMLPYMCAFVDNQQHVVFAT